MYVCVFEFEFWAYDLCMRISAYEKAKLSGDSDNGVFISSIVVSVDIIFFPVLTKLFERKFDGYIIKWTLNDAHILSKPSK